MDRALREASQRLDLARRCVDEVVVRAEQLGYDALIAASHQCAYDLESAAAIAAGCAAPLAEDDQLFDDQAAK